MPYFILASEPWPNMANEIEDGSIRKFEYTEAQVN